MHRGCPLKSHDASGFSPFFGRVADVPARIRGVVVFNSILLLHAHLVFESRYGTIEELKAVVTRFHEVGIKVLGDVVLNHRCAHYKNQNGIWNIFGGRLNWDDRAVVADDPHFQVCLPLSPLCLRQL